jgi:hypothetical protein
MSQKIVLPIANNNITLITNNIPLYKKIYNDLSIKLNSPGNNKKRAIKQIYLDKYAKIVLAKKKESTKKDISKFRYFTFFLSALIETYLLCENVIFLHASSFFDKEGAHLFLGPSGNGKTTLIKKVPLEQRLSDDTTIIKKEKGHFFVFSSIFDNKKIIFKRKNKHILKSILIIRQSKTNSITKMHTVNKLKSLLENNYILMNKKNLENFKIQTDTKKLAEIMLQLINSVSIKVLSFNNNIKASDLLTDQR